MRAIEAPALEPKPFSRALIQGDRELPAFELKGLKRKQYLLLYAALVSSALFERWLESRLGYFLDVQRPSSPGVAALGLLFGAGFWAACRFSRPLAAIAW